MKFRRRVKFEYRLHPIDVVPLLTVIALLLFFFMLVSSFVFQSGIRVKLPRAITSETLKEEHLAIVVTGEDVIYLADSITTIKELREELAKPKNREQTVLIKADRRASLGRIIDIWDLCRELGIEKINIATD